MNVKLIAMTPEPQRLIETCARISYDSKNEPFDPKVNSEFIRKLIHNGHESPLEHASATFLIEDVSRACSHQIVRHRLASFSQRSDRYTKYDAKKGSGFALPTKLHTAPMDDALMLQYTEHMKKSYALYRAMLDEGVPPEDARFVMPQGYQTSLYMTANFREWRHFIELRTDKHAQWEIRQVAREILMDLHYNAPDCFFDLTDKYKDEQERIESIQHQLEVEREAESRVKTMMEYPFG